MPVTITKGFAALADLARRNDAGVRVDSARPFAVNTAVVLTRALDDAETLQIRDHIHAHLARGGRVLLSFAPSALAAAATIIDTTGVLTGDEIVAFPSTANVLVDDTSIVAAGQKGPFDGSRLAASDLVPLGSGGEVLFTIGAKPAAVALTVGHGVLVVVGSAAAVHDRELATADNALFVEWALTGTLDRSTIPATKSLRIVEHPIHGLPPVLRLDAGEFERSGIDPSRIDGITVGSSEFMRQCGRSGRLVPERLYDALVDFIDAPPAAGALLVKGVPVGNLPATPARPNEPVVKNPTSEFMLLTVGRLLGQPVGYAPEHGGQVFQNICPTRAGAARQTSTSSAVTLMFHTEAAFHPHRPRYLLLLCLRGDPNAGTTLASVHELIDALPVGMRRILFEARFRTSADESYVGSRPTRLGAPMPVLTGDWDRPSMIFDADLMVGIDSEADAALTELRRLCEKHHVGVVLEPGDLLIVDNNIAVHGRTPFTPRFDGTDRWLQRAFVVADLAPSAAERDGRVVMTRFGA